MPSTTRHQPIGTPEPPFRWDVGKREQLGRLLDGWVPPIDDERIDEVVTCCARVLAFCSDGDLFFVGRSPDNLFDLLSGAFAETSWEERIRPLPVSLKWGDEVGAHAGTRNALRRYLSSLELSPDQINGRERPSTLVDIVAEGRTFGELVTTWHDWADEVRVPWVQLRRKLRLVGITGRTKTSPKTRRWQQHAEWAALLPPRAIKNVSVPWSLWHDFGYGAKASRTFPPEDWFKPDLARPSHYAECIEGLREAAYWYESGRSAPIRERLAAALVRTPGVHAPWLRTLAHELRAHSGQSRGFVPVSDDVTPVIREAERRERNKRRRATWRQRRTESGPAPTTREDTPEAGADA